MTASPEGRATGTDDDADWQRHLVVRLRPDGSLGPATSIPTNEAWLVGRLRLLASPAQNSLLIAWEAYVNDYRVALARVDCVGGL